MSKPHKKTSFYHHTIPFDPIQCVKQLESVGFTREQAEMQSETFFAMVQDQLVTKEDLKVSRTETGHEIKALENKMTLEFESVRHEAKELENKMTLEFESVRHEAKELESKMMLEFESVRHEAKELESKMLFGFASVRHETKELESKMMLGFEFVQHETKALASKTTVEFESVRREIVLQTELVRRDLKIWMGSTLVLLLTVLPAIGTVILHFTG